MTEVHSRDEYNPRPCTDGTLVSRMGRTTATRWLRLRVAFAIAVLVLLPIELSGHRSWPVILLQALLIVGIIATSVLDLRDLRRRRGTASGPPSE